MKRLSFDRLANVALKIEICNSLHKSFKLRIHLDRLILKLFAESKGKLPEILVHRACK